MRRAMVAGNWKMNGSNALVQEMVQSLTAEALSAEVVICPPFPFLSAMHTALQNSQIALAAQNLSEHANGAYTGEVAANMLAEAGCRYVIIGHSERRGLYQETDAMVAEKVKMAVANGLQPIICVGETHEQHQQDLTQQVITQQVESVLATGIDNLTNAVIAYEPVWAIGTGLTATPEQAQGVHALIRRLVGAQNASIGAQIRLLYGGSVKPNNAQQLFAMPDIDGGLIGGAALQVESFLTICKAVES